MNPAPKRTYEYEYNCCYRKGTTLEDIKAQTKCIACDSIWNWLKDPPECMKNSVKITEKNIDER